MTLELEDGRTAFYQWDTGQRLVVTGGCGQIHFCHSGDKTALVCPIREEAGKLVADVPNILLQKAETILAYAYGEGEDGSKTLWARSFAVKPRPKPEDYVYTQTEVLSYETLADRVANLEGEGLSRAVADYLKDNPVQAGATAEEAAQIWQNKEDIAGKLDTSALPAAVEDALSQAKASGEFKGDPGDDYVLTEADKQEIAELTAPLVDVPSGGGGSGSEEPFRLINTITITEEIVNPKINVDSDGKAFSVKEIVLYFDRNTITSTSGKHYIALNSNNAYQISAENYFLTTASVNARRAVYAKIMEGSGLCEIRMYTNAQSANVSMVGYDASGVPSMTKITSVLIKATLTGGTIKLYGR